MSEKKPTRADDAANALVTWIDASGEEQSLRASRLVLTQALYKAKPIRIGKQFPKMRNFHGHYWFSQTERHLWTESRLEATSLAWIDMTFAVDAVAVQPMKMEFADGKVHFPDIIALHSDGTQVVYDVKPTKHITPEIAVQFQQTGDVCKLVGWGYRVCSELPPQVAGNIQWLWNFRRPEYAPSEETTLRILDALDYPRTITSVAVESRLPLAAGRSAIFHLLWTRALHTDLTVKLGPSSLIERTPHAVT